MIDGSAGVSAFLPTGMELVASCFDSRMTVGGGLFAIADGVEEIDRLSSVGLHANQDMLFRCLDGSPSELLGYDAGGIRRYLRLDGVSQPHGILAVEDLVLIVATAQNRVLWIAPDGSVARKWQPPGEPDSWHLNCLAAYDGRMAVSAFGRFQRRRGWTDRRLATGCVVDVESGEVLIDGLRSPHSPRFADGRWLVCNSDVPELLEIAGDGSRRSVPMPAFPRGLAVTDTHAFVGLSSHRTGDTGALGGIAVVDRASWRIVSKIALPVREVYSLELVPSEFVEGARIGFGGNSLRVQEQGQRRLFELAGVRPRLLWSIGDPLPPDECRVTVTCASPPLGELEAGGLLELACSITNDAVAVLPMAPPHPVSAIYRWYAEDGSIEPVESIETRLARSMPPQSRLAMPMLVRIPARAGCYRLRITLSQKDVADFDHLRDDNALDLTVHVKSEGPDRLLAEAMARVGISGDACRKAIQAATVRDAVDCLVRLPDGTYNGLAIGLLAEAGQAVAGELAGFLNSSVAEVAGILRDLSATPGILLSAADAIALLLVRQNVSVVFAHRSKSAIGDSFARLGEGRLVSSESDAASVLYAIGAGLREPGRGVALVSGREGLDQALGAFAALILVEPDHAAISADRAKAWYVLPGAPAAELFAERITAAVADSRAAPTGPVVVELAGDANDAVWVPLSVLPKVFDERYLDQPTRVTASAGVASVAPRAARIRRGIVEALGARLVHAHGYPVLISESDLAGNLLATAEDLLPAEVHLTRDCLPGNGVGMAIGLSLADPASSVVCCVDDRGFGRAIAGLMTAAKTCAPFTTVLLHSSSLAASGVDHAAIARALGMRAWRIDLAARFGLPGGDAMASARLAEFEAILQDALALHAPTLIEIVLPGYSSFWAKSISHETEGRTA